MICEEMSSNTSSPFNH